MNAQVMGNVLSRRLAPVNVCPLNGRRFSYFKRLTSWRAPTWQTLFAVLVPMGHVAIINRLGAFLTTEMVHYRIEVDGVPDPVARDIYDVGPDFTYWEYPFFWSMGNRATTSMYIIQAKMLLDPILVQQNQIFSLKAWPWWPPEYEPPYGLAGGVMGFFAPLEWYVRNM